MSKSENQKLKILYIAKYFLENSDENHPTTANDILDYLRDDCGIEAERKSIYRDIALLKDEYGMDIESKQGGKYRLLSRQFEFDDLHLLAECVYAAKFISVSKSKDLINTISELCSTHQAELLKKDVFLCDRVKSIQKGTLNIISTINAAMAKRVDGKPHTPQKISFKYLTYSIKDVTKQKEKGNGSIYKVSPFQLLINDGNYYLLAFDDNRQAMRTYRIDRMKQVQLVDEEREGAKEFAAVDMSSYTKRVFSMFGGEKEMVSIRFINPLLDAVIDRFGTGAGVYYRPDDEQHFIVRTEIEISPQFFGWVCGFGKEAKIVSPAPIAEQFHNYIKDINSLYEVVKS